MDKKNNRRKIMYFQKVNIKELNIKMPILAIEDNISKIEVSIVKDNIMFMFDNDLNKRYNVKIIEILECLKEELIKEEYNNITQKGKENE